MWQKIFLALACSVLGGFLAHAEGNAAKRKPTSTPDGVEAQEFQHPYFLQILDRKRKIVCYSRNSSGNGDISCVKYLQENKALSVTANDFQDPYFFQLDDQARRVVCYSQDSSGANSARKNMSCMTY